MIVGLTFSVTCSVVERLKSTLEREDGEIIGEGSSLTGDHVDLGQPLRRTVATTQRASRATQRIRSLYVFLNYLNRQRLFSQFYIGAFVKALAGNIDTVPARGLFGH